MTSSIESKVVPFGLAVDTLVAFVRNEGIVETQDGQLPSLRKLILDVEFAAQERVTHEIQAISDAVESANESAQLSVQQAQIATTAALGIGIVRSTKATGLADTNEGQTFTVPAGGDDKLLRATTFLKNGGMAVEIFSPPQGAEVDAARQEVINLAEQFIQLNTSVIYHAFG